MSYSIPAAAVVDYLPERMASFHTYAFEWIDNLNFVLSPSVFVANPAPYIEAARRAFLDAGWDGDGEIGLLWVPPFVLPAELRTTCNGLVLWHVKQLEDGTSWLLSLVELPFVDWARWLR